MKQKAEEAPATEVVAYPIDEGECLSVKLDAETVWLTQKQMATLFGCDRTVVTKHLGNIFSDGELDEKVVCAKFALTTQHGAMSGATQTHDVTCYNLDAVISVGFRVNSKRGIAFRQWANKVIKERMVARLSPKAKPRVPSAAERNRPLGHSRSRQTCIRCLFGRPVANADGVKLIECHAARPTSVSGFPLVRPDDFCPCHVTIRGRVRSYAGLAPEGVWPAASPAIAARAATEGEP